MSLTMNLDGDFVLDGSVTLAWYFQDEADPYADRVRESLDDARALVPTIWPLEIANVLWVGERRGRSTVAQATTWLAMLRALPIQVDAEAPGLAFDAILTLARSQRLPAYDASYLELSLRRSLPIATLDDRLKTAAQSVGVPIYRLSH